MSGIALAIRRTLGERVLVVGVEPAGAPTLSQGMAAGKPVAPRIATQVQGLCPPASGQWNIDVARGCGVRMLLLDDATILAAQERLVNEGGWTVGPPAPPPLPRCLRSAFAREYADLLGARAGAGPLRVAAVVSGGNPDPAQLAAVRARRGSGAAPA